MPRTDDVSAVRFVLSCLSSVMSPPLNGLESLALPPRCRARGCRAQMPNAVDKRLRLSELPKLPPKRAIIVRFSTPVLLVWAGLPWSASTLNSEASVVDAD